MTVEARRGALTVNTYQGGGDLEDRTAALVARRDRVFGPGFPLMYGDPVEVVRGSRAYLYDRPGMPLLDMYNNVAVLGHSHPAVRDAVAEQLGRVNTHTRYLNETVLAYAEDLLDTFPAALDRVLFTCTGSESNDLALRMARHATGAAGVIVTEAAYHGGTAITADCSPSSGAVADWVRVVPAPDAGDGDPSAWWAEEVASAAASLAGSGHGLAALLVDTIFSSDGVHAAPVLAAAADVVRAAGGVVVADEVQPGFGRLGEDLWGFTRHGVVPDLVTLGKPMGNGLPIGAVVARSDILEPFVREVRYFNTFGGSPVAVAAARAVLDTVRYDGLVAHAAEVGAVLRKGLEDLAATSALIGEVRGAGLFVGVDVVGADGGPDAGLAQRVCDDLRARGVLISATGSDGSTLKVRPPLVVGHDEVALFLDELAAVVGG